MMKQAYFIILKPHFLPFHYVKSICHCPSLDGLSFVFGLISFSISSHSFGSLFLPLPLCFSFLLSPGLFFQ